MSEANLWDRIREGTKNRAHFSRIEFNPTEGYPDTSYCIRGIEGHAELKWIDAPPARINTACFGDKHGLRPAQIGWIHTRVKHGGRVFIVAGVGQIILVVPGAYCRTFNSMTYFELGKAGETISPGDWDGFLRALRVTPRLRARWAGDTEP